MRAASQLFSIGTQTLNFSRLPASLAVLRGAGDRAGSRGASHAKRECDGERSGGDVSRQFAPDQQPYGTRIVFTEASPGADLSTTATVASRSDGGLKASRQGQRARRGTRPQCRCRGAARSRGRCCWPWRYACYRQRAKAAAAAAAIAGHRCRGLQSATGCILSALSRTL